MTGIDGSPVAATMQDHWDDLVAAAVLGTDRRDPPPAPDPIADVVDDTVRQAPATRLLDQVAATVAARRAGVLPAPPVAALAGPPGDDRPTLSAAAAERWYHLVGSWPVLEDEWMLTVITTGRRLPAELVPDVLARHRDDPVRRARAYVASGPLAAWLADQLPELAGRPSRSAPTDVDPEALGGLPELPIPAELAALLPAAGSIAGERIAAAIEAGQFAHAHRAVLVNTIARLRLDALVGTARALEAIDPTSPGGALAGSLADLARTRRQMHAELT